MAYTRMYIVVPDVDAEEVSALGAIRVTPEDKKKRSVLSRMRLQPGVSVWYYIDKDPNLFVKWPFIAFEVVPDADEITEEDEFESTDVVPLLDDDYDHEIDYDDDVDQDSFAEDENKKYKLMTYTKIYIAVPDVDAGEVSALGAVRVTSEEMKQNSALSRVQLKSGFSAWYFIDQDPILFAKWPYITCEVIPKYFDIRPMLDDDE